MSDFVRRHQVDSDDACGARWWNESFEAFRRRGRGRRTFLGLAVGGGVMTLWGGAALLETCPGEGRPRSLEALDLQRREGWNVGYRDRRLGLTNTVELDASQSTGWQEAERDLAARLAPEERLRPYAVPTLFQALADPSSDSLRAELRPCHTPAMDEAFARGQALLAAAQERDTPDGLAVVCDLSGPLSVAVAAALAPRFCPVFTFDNWPHPLGVVPSHLTLAACLYYLPLFSQAQRTRPSPAPPLFVLDANRLAPYRDDATQFDNRYVAPLPSTDALRALSVRRILYVRPDDDSLTELDDLNGDFVAYGAAGLDVRAVGMATPPHPTVFWRSYGWGGPALYPTRAAAYRPTPRPTMFSSRLVGAARRPTAFGRVSVLTDPDGRLTSYGSYHRSGSFSRSRSWSSSG